MDRPGLMLSGLSAPAFAGHADAVTAQTQGDKILIEAPDDVSIESVAVQNGPVKKGDQLLRLKSFHLERMEINVALFKEHIDIMERPFKDGRIDQEIAILKQKSDLLNEIMASAQCDVDSLEEAKKAGVIPEPLNVWQIAFPQPPAVIDPRTPAETTSIFIQNPNYKSLSGAKVDFNRIKLEYLAAKLAADQADRRRDDALAKIQLAKDKLSLHEKIMNDLQAAMVVSASVEGHFKSYVATNLFIKRGHILGEISL